MTRHLRKQHRAFLQACYQRNIHEVQRCLETIKSEKHRKKFVNGKRGEALLQTLKGEWDSWTGEESLGLSKVMQAILQEGAELKWTTIKVENAFGCNNYHTYSFIRYERYYREKDYSQKLQGFFFIGRTKTLFSRKAV